MASGNLAVIDWWKDGDGTMHVLTTDGERTYEYMRGGIAEENAKLRQLVEDMAAEIRGLGIDFKRVGWCDYAERMRELGVEV